MMRILLLPTAVAGIIVIVGCGGPANSSADADPAMASGPPSLFKDDVETNADPPAGISDLSFVSKEGTQVKLADYHGESNVILVFTRGFSGMICPFCKAQTSRLIANYDQFREYDAEVLLVYPGGTEQIEEFITAAIDEQQELERVPFPILLDEDRTAVDFLEIAAELAYPSTFILDKEGNVRFAYVGSMPNDRPSIQALVDQLKKIES